MQQIESGKRPTSIDSKTAISRWATHHLLGDTILRCGVVSDTNRSIDSAIKFQQSKGALVIVSNHPTRTEPPRLMHFILTQPILRDRKIVAPISRHSVNRFYTGLGKINDITLTPIVTEKTLEKPEYQHHTLGEGSANYKKKFIEALTAGEIVVLMPQGERSSELGQPKRPTLGVFMYEAREKGIENYGFLFVGFEIQGVKDYASQIDNYNFLKSYGATVGSFLTADQVWLKAKELLKDNKMSSKKPLAPERFIDQVIFDELRKVVPDAQK